MDDHFKIVEDSRGSNGSIRPRSLFLFFKIGGKELGRLSSSLSTLASYRTGTLNFLPSSVASGLVNACTAPGCSMIG